MEATEEFSRIRDYFRECSGTLYEGEARQEFHDQTTQTVDAIPSLSERLDSEFERSYRYEALTSLLDDVKNLFRRVVSKDPLETD